MRWQFISESARSTQGLAARLGKRAVPGWVVSLEGDLGAGKTTFAQGFVEGAGGRVEDVTSPTFTLVQTYETASVPIHHVDLYRLGEPDEATSIGLDDLLYGNEIVLVEWFDKFPELWPDVVLRVHLEWVDADVRNITLESSSDAFDDAVSALEDLA